MTICNLTLNLRARACRHEFISLVLLLLASAGSTARAAISWDADGGTHWWFDEVNWATGDPEVNNVLPPSNASGTGAQDTQINIGTGAWDQGEGVVYDPAADPNRPGADALPFPTGYGPQTIDDLYISRNTLQTNLLTIKGDLTILDSVIVGRSSGQRDVATNGQIIQEAGKVTINLDVLDIGQTDTSNSGFGNGVYEYRSGTLEVGIPLGTGMRLSHGTQSNTSDGMPAGAGGHGRFAMRNPGAAAGGYVRMSNISVASFPGVNDGVVDSADPNGTTKGVGILEFHYENGGTRPIQLDGNLSLNNGVDPVTMATRSARLDLRLHRPVTLNGGVPINLGLVDVDFLPDDFVVGLVQGTGSLGGTFSSADGLTNYPEGALVSKRFDISNTIYKWTISYHGEITWSDPANSVVASVMPGTALINKDVVLIGHSVEVVANDADFDNDLDVDGNDFLIWQRGLGVGTSNASGDADGNGTVNAADLAVWKTQFGGAPPAAAAVSAIPEPAAGLLFAVGAFTLTKKRRT